MKYVAILDSDNELSEDAIKALKQTVFVGDEEAPYCFDITSVKKALEQETVSKESCEDAISREAILLEIDKIKDNYGGLLDVARFVRDLPPVQPKTGHWIMIDKELQRYKCSECGEVIRLYKKSEIPKLEKDETLSNYPFSHCGCRMIDSQESEEV